MIGLGQHIKLGVVSVSYQFLNPVTFPNGVTLKNRVVVAPMTESQSFSDGSVTRDELRYFDIHSKGMGMYITPVANVNDEGKGFEGELSVASDAMISSLKQVAQTIHANGTKAVLQIFSAGRMTNSQILRGKQPVSASAVKALRPDAEMPRALTSDEVEQTILDFKNATIRAIKAGFDGVELHGANTYLLQQFFSPHSNRRTDKWGGTLEKRMAFPLAVIAAAQDVIRETATQPFILGYRISPEEVEKPGITLAQTLTFVKKLDSLGLDYLHVSMGNVWRTSLNDSSDQTPIILKVKQALAQTPLIGVGSVTTPADAEKVMAAGIDLVALGRENLREPAWVEKVTTGIEATIRYQIAVTDLDELGISAPLFRYLLNMEQHGARIDFVPDVKTISTDDALNVIFN
jgi:2,4-dienoyl-CoA reductase-like NADH-dependent reductase (Old Yellow Enzyme family)